MACVDKSVSDLKVVAVSKLFASMETMTPSSPEKEVAEKGNMCDMVNCVFKEGEEPASVNLNLVESGLKDEKESSDVCQLKVSVSDPTHKVAMELENRSDIVVHESKVDLGDDMKIDSGDANMKPSPMVFGNSLDDTETSRDDDVKEKMKDEKTIAFLQEECKKEAIDTSNAVDEDDRGAIGGKTRKGRRKKDVLDGSDCFKDTVSKKVKVDKDAVEVSQVTGRLLRSRTKTMSDSVKVDEIKLNESVVGFKRQMEAECFVQTEFLKEVNESKPQKKQKRCGKPTKMQGEAGFNTKDECFDQIDIQKEVKQRSEVVGRRQKKQKRRGRPPKIQSEPGFGKMKDECVDQFNIQKGGSERSQSACIPQNKQKRPGRPRKMQSETRLNKELKDGFVDQVDLQIGVNESIQLTVRPQKKTKLKNQKDRVINNLKGCDRPPIAQSGNLSTNAEQLDNNLLKVKDVKEAPKIGDVQDQESEITGDSKQDKVFEESNDHTTVEGTVKGVNTKQFNIISVEARREKQQFVRDRIVDMIMKAGWTIEYRPRQGRDYLDAVYVDQKGRTHWSITKAYFSLKNKVEKGDADTKEMAAFMPIPVEEMNVLFRSVSKIRCDKNTKKKKRGKNINKAAIVISGEAPSKKAPINKGRDGKKRTKSDNSAVKLANKLSNVKVKKNKSCQAHGVIAESAVQRRPKVSKNGRQSRKPCLVARSSSKGLDQDNDDCEMYTRKRNIFSWMIDSGIIIPGGKLTYGEGRRRNKTHQGQVTDNGIHCSCCNEVMDISNFVSHGGGKLDQALQNLYYQSGDSFLTCLLESWRKEMGLTNIRFNFVDVKGDDPNDDTCNICGDGGDLICCDGCPSTFHQSCLDIQNFPSGDWHCIYCCCKFCRRAACGASHHALNSEMITCCLCEEKFHQSCLQDEDPLIVGSSSLSFCGRKCQELYEQLQTYIGVKFELKEGYSWTLLKRHDLSQSLDDPMKVECNSKLAVAFSVMDECFVPITDERSGINRIHNVVYNCGSNFRRLDYSGFCTAILEKDGELISAASIRIHGNRLAEMPFIGTRNMYRRQGMCRRLLDAIEGALSSLGVGELVIPAIPELFNTWTKVFGFKPLEESLRQAMKGMSLIVFPGTDMLRKPLLKNQFADKNSSPVAVSGDKAECITVENDGNTLSIERTLASHLESEKPIASFQKSGVQFSPSDDEHKSVGLVNTDVTGVKTSLLTSKTVPKNSFDLNINSFDLNLQPGATDIDAQSVDEESMSGDQQG